MTYPLTCNIICPTTLNNAPSQLPPESAAHNPKQDHYQYYCIPRSPLGCKFWHIWVQAQTNLAQHHSQPLTVPFLTTTPIHFGSTFFGCFFVFPSLLFFEYMCLYYVSILYKDLSCNSQIKHPAVLFSSPVCSQSLAHSAHPHSFKFFIDLALLFLLHLPTVLAPLFCHVPTRGYDSDAHFIFFYPYPLTPLESIYCSHFVY